MFNIFLDWYVISWEVVSNIYTELFSCHASIKSVTQLFEAVGEYTILVSFDCDSGSKM